MSVLTKPTYATEMPTASILMVVTNVTAAMASTAVDLHATPSTSAPLESISARLTRTASLTTVLIHVNVALGTEAPDLNVTT